MVKLSIMLYLFVCQKKRDVMVICLFLLEEGKSYSCTVVLVISGIHSNFYGYLFDFLRRRGMSWLYSCISNIRDELINKQAQSIAYSVTNKHHAYSQLECSTTEYISKHIYRFLNRYRQVDSYDYSHMAINTHASKHQCHVQYDKIYNTVNSTIHFLGQDNQNGVQHEFLSHVMPLALASCNADNIISHNNVFLKSR